MTAPLVTESRVAELANGIFGYRGDRDPTQEQIYFSMQARKAINQAIREVAEECAKIATDIWDQDKQGAHGGEQANRTAAAIHARIVP